MPLVSYPDGPIKTEVGPEPESQEAGSPRAKREAVMGGCMQRAVSVASGPGCHQWTKAGTDIKFLPLCSGAKRHVKTELAAPSVSLTWLMEAHRGCLDSPG